MTAQPGSSDAGGPPRHGRHRNTRGRRRAMVIAGVVVALLVAAGLLWFDRSSSNSAAPENTAATENTPAAENTAVGGTIDGSPAPTAGSGAVSAGDANSSLGSGSAATSRSASGASTPAPATPNTATGPSGTCPLPAGTLRIAVAPGMADVVAGLIGAADSEIAPGCTVTVRAIEPAVVAAKGSSQGDVWIPDSSMWVQRAEKTGITIAARADSVANSPVVLALPAATATRLGSSGAPDITRVLESRSDPTPVRVGLPDPAQSASADGVILAARSSVSGKADARAALTWAVRSSPAQLPIGSADLLRRLSTDPNTAVPVSEQAVVSHNAGRQGGAVTAVYPRSGGVALDFPVVALGKDQHSADGATALDRLLTSDAGQKALLAAGFRAPDGSAGSAVKNADGVKPAVIIASPLPSLAAVDDAISTVAITNEPSRLLAVMDISGSMQSQVPGANGASRMDLAKAAATRGLGLYGPSSEIGLWVFSRTLTPTSDHRELIPVSSLGPTAGGPSGAGRLTQALAGIEAVPEGGTGLYDTVLAAVRTMRAAWDPHRVNAVLILSDGINDDQGSMSLPALLAALEAEQSNDRPVPVISIAFGPDSDVRALAQISKATGGAAYESIDPRQVGEIFLDAVGQRLCRPTC